MKNKRITYSLIFALSTVAALLFLWRNDLSYEFKAYYKSNNLCSRIELGSKESDVIKLLGKPIIVKRSKYKQYEGVVYLYERSFFAAAPTQIFIESQNQTVIVKNCRDDIDGISYID